MIVLITQIPLAHAGHWAAGLLYMLPVVILAGGIFWQRRNDRKARARGDYVDDDDVPFTDE
jgi:cytochrome c-type biogenesis protein CcmH/NrfF